MIPAATVNISKSASHFFHSVARLAPTSPLSGLDSGTGWSEIAFDILVCEFSTRRQCNFLYLSVTNEVKGQGKSKETCLQEANKSNE